MNYTQKIMDIAERAGVESEDLSQIVTEAEKIDGKHILYYTFKIFSPDTEDMFILGTVLGQEFGANNIWIDTYKATQKYLGYSKIEIAVR